MTTVAPISTSTHKLTFETGTCTRCMGSGEYSFNALDGTRCYGCGGSGVKLTRAGRAAKVRFEKLLNERMRKSVTEVKAGDTTRHSGPRAAWRKVIEVGTNSTGTQLRIEYTKIIRSHDLTDTVVVLDREVMAEIFTQVIKLKGATATKR